MIHQVPESTRKGAALNQRQAVPILPALKFAVFRRLGTHQRGGNRTLDGVLTSLAVSSKAGAPRQGPRPARTDLVRQERYGHQTPESDQELLHHRIPRDADTQLPLSRLPGYLIPFDPATFVLDQWKHPWRMLSLSRVWLGSKNFTSRRAIPPPPSVPLDHYLPP